MSCALVTGGSGFFGQILKKKLSDEGWNVVSYDLVEDKNDVKNVTNIVGDVRDADHVNAVLKQYPCDAVFHCAAVLAHESPDPRFLWTSNVNGTQTVADCAAKNNVKSFVFISSNCLWGDGIGKPVREDEPPHPVEEYGLSKLIGEHVLQGYADKMNVTVFRSPTIMDAGRLGLLSILFEFIYEGRRVWVVGAGDNKYQFIAASDLANACLKAVDSDSSHILNIGSDDVATMKEMYASVIQKANTGAKLGKLPQKLTVQGMKLAHKLHLSPLGPYQYKMMTQEFVFDTTKIKSVLNWQPTRGNKDMLWDAYEYYSANYHDIYSRKDVSSHRRPSPMGIIRLLKWLS